MDFCIQILKEKFTIHKLISRRHIVLLLEPCHMPMIFHRLTLVFYQLARYKTFDLTASNNLKKRYFS